MKLKTPQKITCLVVLFAVLSYGVLVVLPSWLDMESIPVQTIKPLLSMRIYESLDLITLRDTLEMNLAEQHLSVWKHVPTQVENTAGKRSQLIITPSMIPNGGKVMVVWRNIPEHDLRTSMDWIALYCPSQSPHSQVIDFWWVKNLTGSALESEGNVKFNLYNVRSDCQFRYFISDVTTTKLVALSNTVNFENSQNAHLHIHLALTGSPSEMRVQWTTGKNCVPTVHYGSSPNHLPLKATGVSRTYKASDMCGPPANMSAYFIDPGYLYDVLLTDLTPNTQYYYQVSGTGVSSEVMSFRTPPPPGSDGPFSFIIYGDMDITRNSEEMVTSALRDVDRGTSFVLHIGDLSYATGLAYRWDEWMTLIEPLSSCVPYMVSVGNHEQCISTESKNDPSGEFFRPAWGNYQHDSGGECGVPTSKRFHMPDNGNGVWWYSFKYGLAHIIQISTEHSLSPGSVQYTWLERELESVDRETTPWLIVTGHRSMYISAVYPPDNNVSDHLKKDLEELFHTNGVDLYVAAHYHAYERVCSVYRESCTPTGTVHITVGTAGMFLDASFPYLYSHWSKHYECSFGYGRVTVANKSALHWEFVRSVDNFVSDHVWLLK